MEYRGGKGREGGGQLARSKALEHTILRVVDARPLSALRTFIDSLALSEVMAYGSLLYKVLAVLLCILVL